MPGQLGPINLDELLIICFLTFNISKTGIPSVIHTINSIFASIASIIADAANLGGTYIIDAFAAVFSFASSTVLKTGSSKCCCPPFFGVTPPTKLVPYLIACSE